MSDEEKLFTCGCGASFKTDQELHEHHQSEHGGTTSDKVAGTVRRIDPRDKTVE
jgi:hypothetical protein